MMSVQIVIAGARGKMGQIAKQAIAVHPNLTCIGEINRGDDYQLYLQKTRPDVVIDLTEPNSVYRHTELCLIEKIRPVIGTSGLTEQEIQALTQLAQQQQIGGLIVPNFSIAALLMMQCAKHCAPYLVNPVIIESHHLDKKDAPSATALRTAELIDSNRANKNDLNHKSQEKLTGALGAMHHNVPIHSIRSQGVIADQTIRFSGLGETLTIAHHTQDRTCFISGIQQACQAVMRLSTLTYGLEQVLFSPSMSHANQ